MRPVYDDVARQVKEWQTLEPGPDEAGDDQHGTENDEKAIHDGQRLQDSANPSTSSGVANDPRRPWRAVA
jgi:hypothetical protein